MLYSLLAAWMLFVISIIGYWLIEDYTLIEAFYMTMITLSTVGFGEVRPLSPTGQVFTAIVILIGIMVIAILFSILTEYIITGELSGTLRKSRMSKKIASLKDHFIICGYGRIGEQVAVELQSLEKPFVVIDQDRTAIEKCGGHQYYFIEGDATQDEILRQAGIDHAHGLVAVLNADADNVFVVLSARSLNPNLTIVARATQKAAEHKLRKAGANRVVSPYNMAGYRIVNQLIRPHVTFFLDIAMRSQGLDLVLDEIGITEDSSLNGKSMAEANVRARTGANILTILRGAEHQVVDWSPELQFEPKDMLIAVGKPDELRRLADLAGNQR
ncbi:MAG: potassium channel protein [Anaerolineae bacterium]|nr:potassium channel protein [Anaerolineae bacterium]